MRSVDKKCKLIKKLAYPWSFKLAQAGGRVSYWKLRKHIAQGLIPPTDLDWRILKISIIDSKSTEIEFIKNELKKAWFSLYHIQEHTDSLRKTYLEELAIELRSLYIK